VDDGRVGPAIDERWDARSRKSFIGRQRTFWGFVDDTADGCWPWLGPHRGQYGCYPIVNMLLPAHRAMLLYLGVDVPPELVPDHLCEIKRCVSPNHLEVVTRSQNTTRGRRRAPHESRPATITREIPEDRQLWRRKTELNQRRTAEGWRPPALVDGLWVAQYGGLPAARPTACRCDGCRLNGPGYHHY
jgi:hypothetical protein